MEEKPISLGNGETETPAKKNKKVSIRGLLAGAGRKTYIFLCLLAVVLLSGVAWFFICPKGNAKTHAVHVAGWEENSKGVRVATLWKNGKTQYLSDGSADAEASSVLVSGNDVFVAGWTGGKKGEKFAALWKNGKQQHLDKSGMSVAVSVSISGNNIYVLGTHGADPVLWKNGAVVENSGKGALEGGSGTVNAVFASEKPEKNVYVAGTSYSNLGSYGIWCESCNVHHKSVMEMSFVHGGEATNEMTGELAKAKEYEIVVNSVATLWKNVTASRLIRENNDGNTPVHTSDGDFFLPQRLSSEYKFTWGRANSVYVAGNDVYVAGVESNKAMLWINGMPQHLSTDDRYSEAFAVFASGDNVYAAGIESNLRGEFLATLWSNGSAHYLSNVGHATKALSVFSLGSDVYVVGCENGRAVIWKNGKMGVLNTKNRYAEARSVYVSNIASVPEKSGIWTRLKQFCTGYFSKSKSE